MDIKKGIVNVIIGFIVVEILRGILVGVTSPMFVEAIQAAIGFLITLVIMGAIGQFVRRGMSRFMPGSIKHKWSTFRMNRMETLNDKISSKVFQNKM